MKFYILLYLLSNIKLGYAIYCGRDNCYEILNLTRDASKQDIAKNYRTLARKHHPDRFQTAEEKLENQKIFQKIAQAYEVLKDEEARKDYDYLLDHPDDIRNYYYYYRRRYSPKVDVRIVLAVLLTAISAIQYWTSWQKYNEVVDYFLTVPKYRIKAKEIAERDGLIDSGGNSGKRCKNRIGGVKLTKEEMKLNEENILKTIIRDQMDIKGAYAKPEWTDILAVQIVMLPYLAYKYIVWYVTWIYKFNYLKLPYYDEQKLYLIRRYMKMSEAQFNQFSEEEQLEYLDQELWIKSNFDVWQKARDAENKAKLLQSGKYKSYRRWMKKGGPGQISFVED